MKKVEAQMDLPKLENDVLRFWDENKTFEKSLANRQDCKRYSFYDGPPFATGTPHYGHIVASTMKDVVPRYWTMKGYYVERKWGWDCHGLPIENIAEKVLGIKHKTEIEQMGVAKFNAACRSKVLEYVEEWKVVINRLGRWADMENSYKTMDLSYMESVWWVFKQLWDKGLIYEGYRSMHICPRCETTLSQTEVAEGYKDVKDLSVIAKFHLKPGQKFAGDKYETKDATYILAWTTTPWTLLGNVALAVGDNIKYSALRINGEMLILASDRVQDVFKDMEYELVHNDLTGADLVDLQYDQLFNYGQQDSIDNAKNGWRVVDADFVTTVDGTGVVHIAPAFGEDDLNLGKEKRLPFIQHIGMDGVVKPNYGEFSGLSVKPIDDVQKTDVEIIKYLAEKNMLFRKEKYEHSYPHCWRCDTPLLNFATSSWFVAVEKVKEEALTLAKGINWTPPHIKKGRFGNWLEGARDWSISRQRYWASVIPVWVCNDCGEKKVVGSIKELEELSGCEVTDLHKDVVDEITFKCPKCSGVSRRIPDVLDTWFDSGSMPYAQNHYPFENKEKFESNFPAEFIAEGEDQTRAWFYYLHVISSAIFKKQAFKNVIVNGTVLAEDGKKMAKRLQNYPDPTLMLNKYGADVMRYYLMSSPVVAAENLNFSEKDMAQISRGMFRMLWNSYYFFSMYAELDGWKGNWKDYQLSANLLDKWIVAEVERLNLEVIKSMDSYDLLRASRAFGPFIDNMSNWYIRRSRKRFWKSDNDADKNSAYETLNYVLSKVSLLLAPFCPFIAEEIYKNLTEAESVHLEDYPEAEVGLINDQLADNMVRAREIIEKLLALREKSAIKVRQPLGSASYVGSELEAQLAEIVCEEVNIKELKSVKKLESGDEVSLDTTITRELKLEGIARDIIRELQVLRKKIGLEVSDRINVHFSSDIADIDESLECFRAQISNEVLADKLEKSDQLENAEKVKIGGQEIGIYLEKAK